MSLNSLLNRWQSDPAVVSNIAAWETIPRRQAQYVPFPADLHPDLIQGLQQQNIHRLYKHQLQVWDLIKNGLSTALVTGTASGKTMAYNLPVLDSLLKDRQKRALYLFPTKALAHDQLHSLQSFFTLPVGSYDGDTPTAKRPAVRDHAHIIISNPDMLHLGILPHHTSWVAFFNNLEFVVLDEMHTYRGVFGSHVANVLRRLKRVANYYGSQPQFLLTSATIGNPAGLAEKLIEEPVALIEKDYSSRGEKHFLIYNPPIIDDELGLRAGMQRESERLTADLLSHQIQTILFGRSRKSVEFMITRLRERNLVVPESLQAYRSGYLPQQRRDIEARLRDGSIKAVAATTALELGIDIGSMDATVLAGYPGTISGTWQQAGRSGRNAKPSLSLLVVSSHPLDQFLAHHPHYFFQRPPEQALLDPNNLLILLDHIRCAAFELPFQEKENFGNLDLTLTQEFLNILTTTGSLHHSDHSYYWMSSGYPASNISLRTTSSDQIILRLVQDNQTDKVLGTIDRSSAYWMVHPGAIYLHQASSYQVTDLNLENNTAYLKTAAGDYYTKPEKKTTLDLLNILQNKISSGSQVCQGEIAVIEQVTGFKKVNWGRYEVLAQERLDLPSQYMETTGYWITLQVNTVRSLQDSGIWTSGLNDYGPEWQKVREQVLERDDRLCQVCGKGPGPCVLHVHHKTPLRSFSSIAEANRLDNLLTVCPRCHQRLETVVRVRTGLSGLAYALHHLAPLFLMCDRHDLGVHIDPQLALSNGQPTVVIYENIPAGLGFSTHLYRDHDNLMAQVKMLISDCPCRNGCPSCVGPGGELGSGGKEEALAILDKLTS